MSTTNFYTPGFVRMVNVRLGQTLSPLVTGQLVPGGQIQAPNAQQRREIVLDRERERSHYFDGKLLKARDLLRDQNYLDARLRQAGRAFGAGIVYGLDAALDDGWVSVQPGVAISPSGRVLELKDHVLRAPVDDAALRAALNRGRYGYLSSGLYLLLVSWHEQTSDAIHDFVLTTTMPGGHDRLAAGHGLEDRDRHTLRIVGRQGIDVARRQQAMGVAPPAKVMNARIKVMTPNEGRDLAVERTMPAKDKMARDLCTHQLSRRLEELTNALVRQRPSQHGQTHDLQYL